MQRFLKVLVILFAVSCQEEINPIVKPNPNPGNGNGNNPDETPVEGKYSNCLSVLSDTTIDIVTWNIEHFPKSGSTTITYLVEMITAMNPDLIAVQEIESTTNFNYLISNLSGYSGVLAPGSGQRAGYIYKTSEIVSFEPATELFTNDNCAFPRPALKTVINHVSGKSITLINVHLKCCDDGPTSSCPGGIDRRQLASTALKNYIDQSLPNNAVVILGDWNDDITQPEGNNVFTNFVNDEDDYLFADMEIAEGSNSYWSYPSWPSHLDHILITNELFDQVHLTKTIRFGGCESNYFDVVSDHYPVMLRLKAED